MTITGAAPAHYEQSFACCGGCSSSKRADAYNGKFVTGSLVFIWEIKLKTNPQPVCSLTFPYDPSLNEQMGERRVRSGRMVGTNYPIDNDFDFLCCEQRGECRALNEDASGKCQCVNRWGFTGDHCEYSVYDVAEVANAAIFPNSTNLSSVDHFLPDLRQYLLPFDYDAAITSATASPSSSGLVNVLESDSYRQYAWSTTAYFVLAAIYFAILFIVHVIWTFCFFKCGCRRRNPLAKPKVYSKFQKILWGWLMMLFLLMSTAAVFMTAFVVIYEIKPLAASVFTLLNETLPNKITTFEMNFLVPMDELVTKGYIDEKNSGSFSLSTIQQYALTNLSSHTFLDNQSYANDMIGKLVFDLLDPLTNYSLLYPTVNSDSIECEHMNITQPSVTSRMTIGGKTGCFKCKRCLDIVDLIAEAKNSWQKHIFEVQIDMVSAKNQLKDFNQVKNTLTPAIQSFLKRMRFMCTDFRTANSRLSDGFDTLAAELHQISQFSLFGLCGLCGVAVLLAVSAFVHGISTGNRKLGRSTCFVVELAVLLALIVTGVCYTMSFMAMDGIIVLQRLDENTSAFFSSIQSAEDVNRLLFDQNFVEATNMTEILAFSDTLRLPPHPTPATDNPKRFNFSQLYDMPALFSYENLTADPNTALVEMFAWDEAFVTQHWEELKRFALVDSEVATPYNESIHQNFLNSTIQQLMDPDNDGDLVTVKDLSTIQTVFNASWRGLDDAGVSKNQAIQTQWLFVAQLQYQKQKLETYVTTVSEYITKIHPVLENLVEKTAAMEDVEFQLKSPVEFVTDSIRNSKIADCNYNGNCAWFREILNELFDLFQKMILKAERAVISSAVSVISLLIAVLCTNAFTCRIRRNVVKVYASG